MYIKIHIKDVATPLCVPIEHAGEIAVRLEKEGKTFRLGSTV